jgi:dihydroorotate dehydrogenase
MGLVWEKIVRPVMFGLDAEHAHELGMKALTLGLARPFSTSEVSLPEFGNIERLGLTFKNPVGIAAGFDKNALAVNELASLGFGFVEVGTVTLRPQKGNEKPRLFRLPEDKALINRLGFNNDGAEAVAERLKRLNRKCVVGVNIGKNKDVPNEEAVENYLACFDIVHPFADYIAVNVSSPNTPNLRELQRTESLDALLAALQSRNRELNDSGRNATVEERVQTPLLVKIAPDLSKQDIEEIVDICRSHSISGIIATNTTISREGLKTSETEKFGEGGLSGKPLARRANDVISTIFRHSKGKLPIIGVGGIFTAEDAFDKIAAGASLLQAYTGFVYGGPRFANEINTDLAAILTSRGFSRIDDAIGSDVQAA